VVKTLKALITSMRPRQWLKNTSLFAAILFGGEVLNATALTKTLEAAIVFSFLSSAAYLFNDVNDRGRDRRHPLKKERPIAKGTLPVSIAVFTSCLLALGSLAWAGIRFSHSFFALAATFLLLQLSYSLYFRSVIILDALVVAMAFVLRVYAGAFVMPTPISSWLILSVIGLALLLAFGKRRSEWTLLSPLKRHPLTRETLRHYPDTLLDSIISMAAAFTTISYAIFSFQTSPITPSSQLLELIPPTLATPKWMMLTIPLVIYGVSRYLYIIYEKKEGESPEKALLSDWPLLATTILWATSIFIIIYGLGG